MTVTSNWNDFGHREIADAKELYRTSRVLTPTVK